MTIKILTTNNRYNVNLYVRGRNRPESHVFSSSRTVLGHASTYRILLRKAGSTRIAIMIDSPYHAYDQTRLSTIM